MTTPGYKRLLIGGIAALAVGLSGCSSPTHEAGPTPDPNMVTEGTVIASQASDDETFINALVKGDVPISDNRYRAIMLGHSVCKYLNTTPGTTAIDAVSIVNESAPTVKAAAVVVDAAISSYCPEHS